MTQEIQNKRISDGGEHYAEVFRSVRQTTEAVRVGAVEPGEATAMARNDAIAQKVLDGDLKSRLVEQRLRMRSATEGAPQIEASKAAAA